MSFPISVNLDESLKVEIHLHQLYLGDRDRHCWTYLTRGLQTHQQREMCLSLLVDDEADIEDFPKTPIKMFQLLAERTRSGRAVVSGESTQLAQKGMFGFPSLFYVPSIQYEGLPSVDNYLSLILVHREEYRYARQYGLTRFLSRLGKFCSSFPYPTWNTPARPSLFSSTTQEHSILSDASHVLAEYSYAHQLGSVLQFQLHQKDAGRVKKALAGLQQNQIAVINTGFSARCDASLYWQEGQAFPGAYAAQEETSGLLGGSFISIGFSQFSDISIEEDGFSVLLSGTDWDSLHQAISNEETYGTELPDGRQFVMNYLDAAESSSARPYNPVAVWKRLEQPAALAKTPEPEPEPEPEPARFNVRTEFYDNLPGTESINQDELRIYIERLEATIGDAMSEETDSFVFQLELNMTPGGLANVRVLSDIDLNPDFEAFITGAVQKIEPCRVTSEIQIRVPFQINQE